VNGWRRLQLPERRGGGAQPGRAQGGPDGADAGGRAADRAAAAAGGGAGEEGGGGAAGLQQRLHRRAERLGRRRPAAAAERRLVERGAHGGRQALPDAAGRRDGRLRQLPGEGRVPC